MAERNRGLSEPKASSAGFSLPYFNYLSNPFDLGEMIDAVKRIRELVSQPAFDEFRGAEVDPGVDAKNDSELADFVRRTASTDYHPSCSCKMGNDDMAVVDRVQDEDDPLDELVEDRDLFLDIPLLSGKKFCEAEYITLYNGGYCWLVKDGHPVEFEVVGLNATDTLVEYGMVHATRPDHVYLGFIPGVGISQYVYRHHGTIAEVDVRLVEYYPGEEDVHSD